MESCPVGRCGETWRAERASWAISREVKALEGGQGQGEPAVPHGRGTHRQQQDQF